MYLPTFKVVLNSDNGLVNIYCTANDKDRAVKMVCHAENAPTSAVVSVTKE